jgi:hypothetical protein
MRGDCLAYNLSEWFLLDEKGVGIGSLGWLQFGEQTHITLSKMAQKRLFRSIVIPSGL